MNSKNNKTSDPYRLLFNFTDKINLKRSDKYIALGDVQLLRNHKVTKILTLRKLISNLLSNKVILT